MVSVLEVTGAVTIGYVLWKALAGIYGWTHLHHELPHASHTLKRSTSAEKVHAKDVLRPFFTTKHGFALYVRKWLPRYDTKPRGVVFLVHGLGEHGGRYDHVARLLARAGFAVFCVDHQGHGLSDGERLFAQKIVHIAEDHLEFVNHVLHGPQDESVNASILDPSLDAHADVDFSKLPRFVLGHSLGGVITLLIAELSHARKLKWDGIVLSAPAIYCAPLGKHPWFLSLIAKLSTWMPKITLPPIGLDVLFNDPDVATRWLRDPLRPEHGATVRLTAELITNGRRFAQDECKFTTEQFDSPLYLLHGEHDRVCFVKGSVRFYTKCTTKDKTLNVLPTDLHELLNLDGYDQVVQEIIEWIGKHLDN